MVFSLKSKWASPCLVVPKTDGDQVRTVTDFWKLNVVMKPNSFPLPRIKDLIDVSKI